MAQAALRKATKTDNTPSPQHIILGLALAYLASRSLHAAAGLGIADLLGDGVKSVDELALATGAHRPSLYRLLRVLAGHGVFAEEANGRFRLTPAAKLLQSGIPGSLRDAVNMIGDIVGDNSWWTAVGSLRDSVMTGEPGFQQIKGMGFFDYLSQHPEAATWFDRGLANFATAENAAIAAACNLAEARRIIDVGGGQGGFLAELLKLDGAATGLLYDLPHVAHDPAALAAAGLLHRCETMAGDFFQSVPAKGDAYILKRILHDWNDEQCVQILRRCREAMADASQLLVIDAVIPPGNDPHPGKIMDILMMALTEGRERSEAEFRELYRKAGLKLTKVIPTPTVLSIIAGKRA